jgi:hypothetical protein
MKMVQIRESTLDFEIFGAQPWHRQGCVWHDNQLVSESLTIA